MQQKKGVNSKFLNLLANEAGLETGLSLGMLGATHGTLLEAAKQSSEIEQGLREGFDPWKMTWEGAKHGASNIGTGYAAGYLTKGLMAPKYAKARAAKNPSQQQTITKLTMNPVGQVAAEASVFTTGQVAQQLAMGEPVDTDSFMSSLFMNLGIVGGMRASTKILRRGQSDLTRFTAAKKKFYNDIYGEYNAQKKALKIVEETYTKNGETPPKEIIEKLASLEVEKELSDVVLKEFGTTLKNVNDRMKSLNNKAPEKWTAEERAFVMKNNKIQMNLLYEVYKQMSANKEIAYEAYAKDFGTTKEKLTASQKLIIDKMIENKLATIEKGDRVLNGLATGDKNAIKEMNELMGESYDYKITEKNNKFELSVETPNEEKILIGTFDSKKEASNQSAAIKNIIKDKLEGQEVAPEAPSKVSPEVVKETPGEPAPVSEKPVIPIYGKYSKVGDASKKPVNLRDNKKSDKEVQNEILSEVISIKEKVQKKEIIKDSTLDVTEGELTIKQQNLTNLISKNVKDRAPSEKRLYDLITTGKTESRNASTVKGKIVKEVNSKEFLNVYKNSNSTEKIILADIVSTILEGNASKVAKQRIDSVVNFVKSMREKNKSLEKITEKDIAEFYDWMEINNLKLTPSQNSGVSTIINVLNNKDWIKKSKFNEMIIHTKEKFNFITEHSGADNPAKPGVRKALVKIGNNLAKNKNDEGYAHASYLALHGVRLPEMANITAKMIKQEGGKYYIDLKGGEFGKKGQKFKTEARKVNINTSPEIAKEIKLYLEAGGNLATGKKGKNLNITNDIGKRLPSDNKIKFYDIRSRQRTLLSEMPDVDMNSVRFWLGHDRSRIDRKYIKKSTVDHIKDQEILHQKLGTKELLNIQDGIGKDFYRPKITGETSKEVHLRRKKVFDRYYPEIKYELEKVFKDKTVPEDAVGYLTKLEDWTVAVKLGKAPSDTIPHEISHYVFKLMNALENGIKTERIPITKNEAYTLRLVKEAKEIFKNKEGKFVEEEAVTMMGKAIDGMIEKPMMSKVKGFFKRFNILLKRLFNRKLDKEEIAYILGKRVLNRAGIPKLEIPGAKEFMRPVDMPVDKLVGSLKYEVRTSAKKLGLKESDLMKFVADTAEIKNPSKFRITLPKDSSSAKFETKVGELGDFYNTLKSFNLEKYVSKKNMIEKLSAIKRIESTNVLETQSRVSKGITLQQQKDILSAFGTKNGDIYQATLKQLKIMQIIYISKKL